jgi:hypothetical protein
MLRFVRIWGDLAVRTARLLSRFYARGDLLIAAASLAGSFSIVALLRPIPWWVVLVGVLLLILYAGALAVFEERSKKLKTSSTR